MLLLASLLVCQTRSCKSLTLKHSHGMVNMILARPQKPQQRCIHITIAKQGWWQLQAGFSNANLELIQCYQVILQCRKHTPAATEAWPGTSIAALESAP